MQSTPDLTKRKSILSSLLSIAALFAIMGRAHAIAPLSDDAELFVTGSASFSYNQNLFLTDQNVISDEIWDFTPGLDLTFGKNSLFKGSLTAAEDWELFSKHSGLNTSLANVVLATNYDDSKTSFSLNGNYQQAVQPTVTVRAAGPTPTLIKRDIYGVDAKGEEGISEKTSVGLGVNYADTDYKTAGYANLKSTTVPVDFYYKVDPKVDVSGGFAYRDNVVGSSSTGSGIGSHDYFVNAGARGEFSPQLTGQLRVGYEEDKMAKGGSKNSTVGVLSGFTYNYSPKTILTFGVNNDYGYNALGAGFRNFGVSLEGTTHLDPQWSVHAGVGYNNFAYTTTTQRDNFYRADAGITYALNANINISGGYTYSDDNSNIAVQSFKNNVVSLSVSARF